VKQPGNKARLSKIGTFDHANGRVINLDDSTLKSYI
jgi:hypothetical protein